MNEDKNIFNVSSDNQSGGITAGIVNIGQEQRILSLHHKEWLLGEISKLLQEKSRKVNVGIINGADGETMHLYSEVKQFILDSSIEIVDGMTTFHPSNPIYDLKINIQDPETIAIMIGPKEL